MQYAIVLALGVLFAWGVATYTADQINDNFNTVIERMETAGR